MTEVGAVGFSIRRLLYPPGKKHPKDLLDPYGDPIQTYGMAFSWLAPICKTSTYPLVN